MSRRHVGSHPLRDFDLRTTAETLPSAPHSSRFCRPSKRLLSACQTGRRVLRVSTSLLPVTPARPPPQQNGDWSVGRVAPPIRFPLPNECAQPALLVTRRDERRAEDGRVSTSPPRNRLRSGKAARSLSVVTTIVRMSPSRLPSEGRTGRRIVQIAGRGTSSATWTLPVGQRTASSIDDRVDPATLPLVER